MKPGATIEFHPEEALDAGAPALRVADMFRRQATRVRRYLDYRLRDVEAGADATQDTFLKLLRREREGGLRDDPNNSYLYSAAFSVAIDAERKRAVQERYPAVDAEADTIPDAQGSPEDQLHWRRAMAHFVSTLEGMEEGPRKVFVMRYFKGMTYPQIAAQVHMTTRTVERHVARALADLKAEMKDYL
jgi:RNA polymerase sigma-19 factor, ECF subfamily